MQIDGVKRWTMVDPIHAVQLYADHVYPPPGPSFGLQIFELSGVDTLALPGIVDAPTRTARAAPGDVLYIPQRWWHEVENLPGRNLGVVLQTSFPPPKAVSDASIAPWKPGFFSRDLLRFAAAWRRDGAAAVPRHLRDACAQPSPAERAEADELWQRALEATTANVGPDDSRSNL